MALIKCPECGIEVSDKAIKCPRCAYPHPGQTSSISSKLNITEQEAEIEKEKYEKSINRPRNSIIPKEKAGFYVLLIILFTMIVAYFLTTNKRQDSNTNETINKEECDNESSARSIMNGFLYNRGYNRIAGEYEAEIIEMRKVSDCSFICTVQIKSYQDAMGYNPVNKSFKVEWSKNENKFIVTSSF
jgi:hypothetical protein